MGWPVFQRKTEENMTYTSMNGLEGIGKVMMPGSGGEGEKIGDEEEREKRSYDQFAMVVNFLENDRKKEVGKEKEAEKEKEKAGKKE